VEFSVSVQRATFGLWVGDGWRKFAVLPWRMKMKSQQARARERIIPSE
jgi:hypothetical protein